MVCWRKATNHEREVECELLYRQRKTAHYGLERKNTLYIYVARDSDEPNQTEFYGTIFWTIQYGGRRCQYV